MPEHERGMMFLAGLDVTQIYRPIVMPVQRPSGPTVSTEEWRQVMLQNRLQSVSTAGLYLDSSPTGAGKSYVDFAVIVQLFDVRPGRDPRAARRGRHEAR